MWCCKVFLSTQIEEELITWVKLKGVVGKRIGRFVLFKDISTIIYHLSGSKLS